MNEVTDYFSKDYQEARQSFLEAAQTCKAEIISCQNPHNGPDGRPIFMDVALLGNPAARHVLLATAGTHGAEGFCGSGAFVGWLRSGLLAGLADNVRVVLVHAVNPYGFAWLRRTNEDNIDMNRNFIDHSAPPPQNEEYEKLHPLLVPQNWDDESLQKMRDGMEAYGAEHGEKALHSAVGMGQYRHRDGVFYGGDKPAWSNSTFRRIVSDYVAPADFVLHQDYHTGLGPYGTADLIVEYDPALPATDELKAIYGEGVSNPYLGDSTSVPLNGLIDFVTAQTLTEAKCLTVTAEFGTYPSPIVRRALMADNWLHAKAPERLDDELGKKIKADLRRAFYPDEDDWKELVYLRSRQLAVRALRALAGRTQK